jgi:3-oxoadipate enol-lactonase
MEREDWMPAIPIGTITLYYESHGKGEPLVLLPDLGNDVTSLWAQVPRLSQDFRCIAIDNRGVGRSSKPSNVYTAKLMAEDAINVLNHLGVDRTHVFGVAMGAAIAQEMAINHPERVDKLALLGAWARPDRYLTSLFELFRDVKRSVDPLTFDKDVAVWSFTRSYFDTSYDELEKRQRAALDVPYPTPATTFTRQAEACIAHDSLDRLDGVASPTLLMVGEEDIFTPRRFSDDMAQTMPNATVVAIEGAAHAAYWEKPDQVNDLVLEHLGVPDPSTNMNLT